METICVYHDDCLDGMAAAWVVKLKYPEAKFVKGIYNKPLPAELHPQKIMGKRVIVVDFYYSEDEMEYLAKLAGELIFLEHHATSYPIVKTLAGLQLVGHISHESVHVRYAENKSGALLAWEFFFPDHPVPRLIQHVSDRDLWQFELKDTAAIMQGVGAFPLDVDVWAEQFKYYFGDIIKTNCHQRLMMEKMKSWGEAIMLKNKNDVNRIIGQTLRKVTLPDGANVEVPMINVPRHLASEALSQLATDAPYAVGYYDSAEGREFSMRSRKEGGSNVSKIAEYFGGGGHRNAAGFKVPRHHPLAQI